MTVVPSPHRAGCADAVDGNSVSVVLSAIGYDLRAILGLEDPVRRTAAAYLRAGRLLVAAAGRLCSVSKGSGRKLAELEDIASKRWQMLYLVAGYDTIDRRGFGIERRLFICQTRSRSALRLQAPAARSPHSPVPGLIAGGREPSALKPLLLTTSEY